MSVPVMSIGIRSGVNWMRLNFSDIVSASLLMSKCLRQTRHAHQERMAASKQADAELLDHVTLAHDHFAQLSSQPIIGTSQFINGGHIVCGQGSSIGLDSGGGCIFRHSLKS
jgi:hypothetical protein